MAEELGVSTETYSPNNIVANDKFLVTEDITLLSGENCVAGEVLGKVTASGKYKASLSTASDGSEVPDMILLRDTDASSEDLLTVAYSAGVFASDKLTIGASHTVESIKDGLRLKGIYLK